MVRETQLSFKKKKKNPFQSSPNVKNMNPKTNKEMNIEDT